MSLGSFFAHRARQKVEEQNLIKAAAIKELLIKIQARNPKDMEQMIEMIVEQGQMYIRHSG